MKKYDFDLGIFKGKVYIEGVFKNTSIGIKKNKIAHIGDLKPENCLQSVEFNDKYRVRIELYQNGLYLMVNIKSA